MLIHIPVLDSVNAPPAVRYVIREHLREQPEVHLLHLRSRLADLEPARELLERFRIRHTVERRTGDKFEAIAAAARRARPDFVVLGTARHGSATRMSEESVIHKLLDGCPAPLVVVAGKEVSRLERYGIAAGLGATLGLILLA
jgi:nucleotide-binding universal stress UspA family protein